MKPDDAELRPAGASQATVMTHRAGRTERATDWLADEGIVSISLNPDSVIETWRRLATR